MRLERKYKKLGERAQQSCLSILISILKSEWGKIPYQIT
jgi:hypothetical protein